MRRNSKLKIVFWIMVVVGALLSVTAALSYVASSYMVDPASANTSVSRVYAQLFQVFAGILMIVGGFLLNYNLKVGKIFTMLLLGILLLIIIIDVSRFFIRDGDYYYLTSGVLFQFVPISVLFLFVCRLTENEESAE